jgi:hypothetical protein
VRFFDGKNTFRNIIAKRIVREVDVYHLVFSFGALGVIRFEGSEVSVSKPVRKEAKTEVSKIKQLNAFQVLDVDYGASDDTIKNNYDALLVKYSTMLQKANPDEKARINESIRLLNQSYSEIKDREMKLQYLKKLFLEEGFLTKETKEVVTSDEIISKGKDYLAKKELTKANLLFLNGIKMFQNVGLLYAYLGYTIFLTIGREKSNEAFLLSEARKFMNKSLLMSSEEEDPHLFYGKFLKYIGKGENAKKEFTKVIQLNPENQEAMQELRLIGIRDKKKGSSFIRWKK